MWRERQTLSAPVQAKQVGPPHPPVAGFQLDRGGYSAERTPLSRATMLAPFPRLTRQEGDIMQMQSTVIQGINVRASNCSTPLDIRCGYALARIFLKAGCSSSNVIGLDEADEWEMAAEVLGYHAKADEDVPVQFLGTPLATLWANGYNARRESEQPEGTQEEWDRLSPDEQGSQWDRFHELCAKGAGEDHYFYSLLMPQWLVGYVGH